MRINVETTSVSCGVDQIYGFEFLNSTTPCETVEKLIAEAITEMAACDGMQDGKLPCAMYLFSDIEGHLGDRFGQHMKEKYGRGINIKWLRSVNPNSGNDIVTYIWRPSKKWINQFKCWRDAVSEAKKEAREWRRDWY